MVADRPKAAAAAAPRAALVPTMVALAVVAVPPEVMKSWAKTR